MAKEHNNILVRGLSGAVGDQFVIQQTRSEKTIIANKPHFAEDRVFSKTQKNHQDAFREASAYAKLEKTQNVYIQKAMETGSIPYNLAISDWFGPPEVLEIDLKGSTGAAGQSIRIKARHNFKVRRVAVVIPDIEAETLEAGEAVLTAEGSPWWTYTTQTQATAETCQGIPICSGSGRPPTQPTPRV